MSAQLSLPAEFVLKIVELAREPEVERTEICADCGRPFQCALRGADARIHGIHTCPPCEELYGFRLGVGDMATVVADKPGYLAGRIGQVVEVDRQETAVRVGVENGSLR